VSIDFLSCLCWDSFRVGAGSIPGASQHFLLFPGCRGREEFAVLAFAFDQAPAIGALSGIFEIVGEIDGGGGAEEFTAQAIQIWAELDIDNELQSQ
jgi:hypothetical protein